MIDAKPEGSHPRGVASSANVLVILPLLPLPFVLNMAEGARPGVLIIVFYNK